MTLTREQKKQKRLKNKFFSYISRLGIFAVETAEVPFFTQKQTAMLISMSGTIYRMLLLPKNFSLRADSKLTGYCVSISKNLLLRQGKPRNQAVNSKFKIKKINITTAHISGNESRAVNLYESIKSFCIF